MAVTMALFWASLVLSIIGSNAAGEFRVLHSPSSLKFTGNSEVPESLLKEIFSASLGLSVEENSDWKGLSVTDPFDTPEAVVEVYIDGVASLGDSAVLESKNYPLKVDEYQPDTYDAVVHRIQQRFTNDVSRLVNVNLRGPQYIAQGTDIFGKISPHKIANPPHLDTEENVEFLNELKTLKAFTEKVKSNIVSRDNTVDFYNFQFRSLHALSDLHGPNSVKTKEAKKALAHAIKELSDAFVKAYDGSVLVTVVTTDVAHTRRTLHRSIRAAENETPSEESEQSGESEDGYSADYPAIFNIILWFGVVFAFTLVAIVYAIMDMDPGRDSIIYRMTSTRMKKDN